MGPTQMRLRFSVDDGNDFTLDLVFFASEDDRDTLKRPALEIEYFVP